MFQQTFTATALYKKLDKIHHSIFPVWSVTFNPMIYQSLKWNSKRNYCTTKKKYYECYTGILLLIKHKGV